MWSCRFNKPVVIIASVVTSGVLRLRVIHLETIMRVWLRELPCAVRPMQQRLTRCSTTASLVQEKWFSKRYRLKAQNICLLFIFYLINTLEEVWHNCRICQDSGSIPERNRKNIWRCMSKDEISYQILYRYSLEKLYSTLTKRVDNVLSFALIFLGVGVTINVRSPFILGLALWVSPY